MKPVEDASLNVTMLDETESFRGFRRVHTYHYREDESGLEAKRELVTGNHSVAVVAFDPKLDRLVMIRQFRLGAHLGTGHGMTVEVVAGMVDEGEDPAACAARELLEESGLEAQNLTWQCQFLTTPGLTNEVIHLYFTTVDASNLVDEAGLESESERTFPFLVTLDDALAAIDSNGIHNGIVMVALLWFARHKNALLAELT